jgi:hypothetical protein
MRAGAGPVVELRGKSWAVVAGGKVQARRKDKARADALLDAAVSELATATRQTVEIPDTERRRGVLFTPQRPEGESIRYELEDASALVPSHRFRDFRPDPRYPVGVQERVYHLDESEKLKVVKGANTLNADLLLARSPSALDGPSMVTERDVHGRRLVIGGNGRSMMVLRAYDDRSEAAERYRRELIRRAPEFGLSPEDVRAMQAPVLVRVLEGLQPDAPRELLIAAVRRTNEGMTQALDATTLGVAQGRALSTTSVEQIGALLGEQDTTLREAMAARPEVFRSALERDGILTAQNRSQWVAQDGALTPEAKDRLELMFLGLVLGTGDRVKATAPALLRKLERAVPHLLAVRGAAQSFDLTPTVQEAVDVLNDAQQRGLSVAELTAQTSLLAGEGRRSPQAERLAALLEGNGQRAVGEAFARWAAVAVHDPNQGMLFGALPTPAEAFEALMTGRLPNPAARGSARAIAAAVPASCSRCSGTGKISPWAQKITACPTCSGTGQLLATAPLLEDKRQERMFNPSLPPGGRRGNVGKRREIVDPKHTEGDRVRLEYLVPGLGLATGATAVVERVSWGDPHKTGSARYLIRDGRLPEGVNPEPGQGKGRGWVYEEAISSLAAPASATRTFSLTPSGELKLARAGLFDADDPFLLRDLQEARRQADEWAMAYAEESEQATLLGLDPVKSGIREVALSWGDTVRGWEQKLDAARQWPELESRDDEVRGKANSRFERLEHSVEESRVHKAFWDSLESADLVPVGGPVGDPAIPATCPHSASQNMGGACERCITKALKAKAKKRKGRRPNPEDATRRAQMEEVWRATPDDYKSTSGGVRQVVVLRASGTTLVPLAELTAEEVQKRLPAKTRRANLPAASGQKPKRKVKVVVVESHAKGTKGLAADLRRKFRKGWPERIRVRLTAETVQRTLTIKGRGAVLQVLEDGQINERFTADLRAALARR